MSWSSKYGDAAKKIVTDSGSDTDFIKQCFWDLRTQAESCNTRISRWLLYAVLAAFIFELLNRKFVTNASFSFVEVTHLTFASYALPPFVSLAFLNVVSLDIEKKAYVSMAQALVNAMFPDLSGMTDLFFSHSGFFGALSTSQLNINAAQMVYFIVQTLGFYIGYFAFEIYAYIELFRHSGFASVATYASLAGSICLLIIAIFYGIKND